MSAAGAARGRLGAQRRQLRRRRVRDLRRGAADRRDRGRPGAVLGHVRPPRAAAADRGQRAGRGDRPARRTSPSRTCAPRARRSSTRSAHDPVEEGLQIVVARRVDDDDRAHGRAGGRTSSRLLELEYWTPERGPLLRARRSSRTRCSTAARAGTSPPATSARTGCATSGWTGSSAPTALDERFEPRADLDPIADIGGWPRTGKVERLARRARVDLARAGALGARGARPSLAELDGRRDRRRVGVQGHRLPRASEVLKEAGDAAVLEPADAREAVLAAAERLARPAAA